jgi:hypothetical protein
MCRFAGTVFSHHSSNSNYSVDKTVETFKLRERSVEINHSEIDCHQNASYVLNPRTKLILLWNLNSKTYDVQKSTESAGKITLIGLLNSIASSISNSLLRWNWAQEQGNGRMFDWNYVQTTDQRSFKQWNWNSSNNVVSVISSWREEWKSGKFRWNESIQIDFTSNST